MTAIRGPGSFSERGSLRADYAGTALRDNLGIPVAGPAASAMAVA